jgi:AmmeMemoRadiSam system protein B
LRHGDSIYGFYKFRYTGKSVFMTIREGRLPPGWYPRAPREVVRFLRGKEIRFKAVAAVAPHAGWGYSGAIAAAAVSALENGGTVVVAGGHLPGGASPLYAWEDAVETPLGPIMIDRELRNCIEKTVGGGEDTSADNTVEVLLPMVKYFLPNAYIVWMRLPADESSYRVGQAIAEASEKIRRKTVFLGSTDLTHYGKNYGFSPVGSGPDALKWMREVNDKAFITAVERGVPADVLRAAESGGAACSAGAVLAAMGFISRFYHSEPRGRLLGYGTSADTSEDGDIPDSFVGYGAFALSGADKHGGYDTSPFYCFDDSFTE